MSERSDNQKCKCGTCVPEWALPPLEDISVGPELGNAKTLLKTVGDLVSGVAGEKLQEELGKLVREMYLQGRRDAAKVMAYRAYQLRSQGVFNALCAELEMLTAHVGVPWGITDYQRAAENEHKNRRQANIREVVDGGGTR